MNEDPAPRIWKLSLTQTPGRTFEWPLSYWCLSMQLQRGTPTAWFHVWPEEGVALFQVEVVPTGASAPPGGEYLGTLVTDPLVHHYYLVPADAS